MSQSTDLQLPILFMHQTAVLLSINIFTEIQKYHGMI